MTITRDNYLSVLTDHDIETLNLWLQITSARMQIINRNITAHPGEETTEDKLRAREYSRKLLDIEQTALTIIDLYKRKGSLGVAGLIVDDKFFKKVSILLSIHTYDLDDTEFYDA